MTPMDVGAIIQSTKALVDISKGMAAIVKRVNDASVKTELNEKIIEVQQRVMELQEAIMQLREENADLRRKVEAATDLKAFKQGYLYEETVSWKKDESTGKRIDGPFCPNCVDEGVETRLNPGATRGTYSCVRHGTSFWTDEFRKRSASPPPIMRSDFPSGR